MKMYTSALCKTAKEERREERRREGKKEENVA